MSTDLALFYYPGCGGFFSLWHLLLSSDYQCRFYDYDLIKGDSWPILEPTTVEEYPDFVKQEIQQNFGIPLDLAKQYQKHWTVLSKDPWTQTELCPSNRGTALSLSSNRLFFYPNPTDQWQNHGTDTKILIYTDLGTQFLLAKQQRKWLWENDNVRIKSNFPTGTVQGQTVFAKVAAAAKNVDLVIKLQDIVKTHGAALLNPLGFEIDQKNIDHTKKWLALFDAALAERLQN